MDTTATTLRAHLEARDIGAFLSAYEELPPGIGSIELTTVTQRILPRLVLEHLARDPVPAADVLALWRLVRSGRLLLVENTLLEAINDRLVRAWLEVHGPDAALPERLLTFEPEESHRARATPLADQRALPVQRIVLSSSFIVSAVCLSDTMSFKKNVCLSNQEREFLKAVRQYFPSFWAYPNVPLRNFIDVDGFVFRLSDRHRGFSRAAQVDILLCTDDEDPVAGFELDSVHHDDEDAVERDQLKQDLFRMAGVPLFRIRPDDTRNVRAEDFYDLLCAQGAELDTVRPRRLRPRRSHDMLVPAGATVTRQAWAETGAPSK